METNCGNYNNMAVLGYECDSQACVSIYEEEVLTASEMSTYKPRLVVVRKAINFCESTTTARGGGLTMSTSKVR